MEKIEPISSRRSSTNIPVTVGTEIVSGLPGNADPTGEFSFFAILHFLLRETIRKGTGSLRKIRYGFRNFSRRIKYDNDFELMSSGRKV